MLFGTKITWEWCMVGCTIGRHDWWVSHEKCRNGTPVIAGYFLTVYKFSKKEWAESACADFQKLANEFNRKNGYWVDEVSPNSGLDRQDPPINK
jgi:hypothetical protein